MFPKICCPNGYTFDGKTCVGGVASPSAFVDPIDCPCCPPGPAGLNYTYFSDNGWFYNSYTGTMMQLTGWTDGPYTDLFHKCGATQAAPFAYGPSFDPVDCPCCPAGYSYDPTKGTCFDTTGRIATDPVPCIVCVCIPPTPFECPKPGDGSTGIRTTIAGFNPFTRHCTACVPQGDNPPKGKINCFIANTLIDPSTTGFVLKNH